MNADGWGINVDLFKVIIATLGDSIEAEVSSAAEELFKTLDTDNNGIIDGLEALATLAMVSSMTPMEKMNFVFTCYDFDESGELTVDEMTLSLKSTVTGLCKISGIPIPTLNDFELIAKLAFQSADKETNGGTISSAEFLGYISTNPTASSWVSSYDDLEADDDLVTSLQELALPESLELEASGAKNFVAPVPPAKLADSAPFLATLEKSKPPPPPPPAEGEEPPPPPPKESTAPPNSALKLEWIHGYSGSMSRSNVAYTAAGGIVYPAATIGVVYLPADEEAERPEPTQIHFSDPVSDITCLATSTSKATVATGTSDGTVYIWNASTAALMGVLSTPFPSGSGAAHLSFSSSDKLLAVCGSDPDNTIAIFDVDSHKLVFTAKTGKSPVLDIAFTSSSVDTLAVVCAGTAGVKPIVFWVKSKEVDNTWSPKKGVFGASKPVALTCVSPVGTPAAESFVTGTLSGDVLIWEGRNLKLKIEGALAGPVTSIFYNSDLSTFAVGGDGGIVKLFSVSLTLDVTETASMDLKATGAVYLVSNTAVASVCLTTDKVLVGTRGNEVLELSSVGTPAEEGAEEDAPPPFPQIGDVLGGGPITVGHTTSSAMSASSASTEYATVGRDMKLFVWDAATHKQTKSLSLDSAASSVAYSADGGMIAVGYSDGPKKGTVSVFGAGAEDPTKLELKGSGVEGLDLAAITVVKFGPSYVAAATDIGEVYLYGLEANAETQAFPLITKLSASTSAASVTAMDVSVSGMEIIVNTDDDVIYFQKPAEPEDAAWGTCTPFVNTDEKPAPEMLSLSTPLFSGLQGLYGDNGSGSYTSVAKPKVVEGCIIAADSAGVISLFPYPSSDYGAASRATYTGHSTSGGISGIAFTSEDGILLSSGGGDGCVFQWTFAPDEGEDSAIEAEIAAANAPPAEEDEAEEEEEENKLAVYSDDDEDVADAIDSALSLPEIVPSNYAAVDMFKATLMPADAVSTIPSRDLPSDDLELKWIHGVSAQTTRNSVAYNEAGAIVYPAGATCVVYNKAAGKQEHFMGHSDAVTSLSMHPDMVHAVSGQSGSSPKVIVWDTKTCVSKKIFNLPSTSVGVSAATFSQDGSLLAVASQDADHTVYIYSWADAALKCSAKTGSLKVLDLAFDGSGSTLLAGGVKCFYIMSIAGKNISVQRGQFGSALGGRTIITCVSHTGGDFVLGTAGGKLYRLEGGRKLAGETEIFEKGHVFSITSFPAPEDPDASGYPALLVAGELGVIKLLDETLGELKSFEMRSIIPGAKSTVVRSACFNRDQRKLLVATKGSEIYEISNPPASEEEEVPKDINDGAIIVGHSSDQLWGLAAHPVKNEIATCGDDKKVSLWDLEANKISRSIDIGDFGRSCDYSPNGHILAVGLGGVRGGGAPGGYDAPVFEETAPPAEGEESPEVEEPPSDPWLATLFAKKIAARAKEGAVMVLSLLEDDIRIVCTNQDAKGYICDIKFSPDGNVLAAASMDSSIYMYDCLKDFILMGKCEAGSGLPVCHLDWSADSGVLMSNAMRTSTTEISYFNSAGASLDPDADEVIVAAWNTWTCTLGKTVTGCYSKNAADPSALTSVSRSFSGKLVSSGDSSGTLRIAKYPALEVGAAYKDYRAHSSAGGVAKTVFTKDDSYVVSIGAGDRCVCVWEVVSDGAEDPADKEYGLSDDSDYALMVPAEEVDDPTTVTSNADDGEEKKDDSGIELTWTEKLAGSEAMPSLPSASYELSAVYGVNPKPGVGYNASGDAVYTCGAASIVYKPTDKKYLVFNGSDGGVTSFGTSTDGKFGLAGDSGGGVKIFDTSTGAPVVGLANADGGVVAVGMSSTGDMCASVANDKDHTLRVYATPSGDWLDGEMVTSSCNVSSSVSFVCFTGLSDGPHLVTGGFNHCMFWTLKNGLGNIKSKKGTFGSEGTVQPLTCGAQLKPGSFVTGTVSGTVFEWDVASASVSKKVTAHTKCVTSVTSVAGGGFVSSGKDGFVKLWNTELMNIAAFDVGAVCLSAACDLKSTKLLAGLSSGELKEIVIDSGFIGPLVSGAKGVWPKGDVEGSPKVPGAMAALCSVAGVEDGVISGAADGVVRKWTGGSTPAASYDCGSAVACVAAKDGIVAVALGSGVSSDSDVKTVEGTVVFLDASTLEGKGKAQKTDSACPTCIVYGSDSTVFMGASDGIVYAFDAAASEFKFTVNNPIGSAVVGVDVSADGQLVAIAGKGGEMKFFTIKGDEKQLADVSGVEWVNGSMPYTVSTSSVPDVCSSVKMGIVGTTNGCVGLLGGSITPTHSGPVTSVSDGGKGVIYTASSGDAGVFCWTQI